MSEVIARDSMEREVFRYLISDTSPAPALKDMLLVDGYEWMVVNRRFIFEDSEMVLVGLQVLLLDTSNPWRCTVPGCNEAAVKGWECEKCAGRVDADC